MGWTAATGSSRHCDRRLVAGRILFFWPTSLLGNRLDLPEDYEKAGFRMISEGDRAPQYWKSAVLYTLALIPAAISPFLLGISDMIYCVKR